MSAGRLFHALAERSVMYNPEIARFLGGDIRAAVLLSQALYWTRRATEPDGSFYKTMEDWQAELAMTNYGVRQARSTLDEHDWWHEDRRGLPAKLYYSVDLEALSEAFLAWSQRSEEPPREGDGAQNVEGRQPNASTDSEHCRRASPDSDVEGQRANYSTETTAETTSSQARDDEPEPSIWEDEYDLEPKSGGEAFDPMTFQSEWARLTGSRLHLNTDMEKLREVKDICLCFEPENLRKFMEQVRHVSRALKWRYFKLHLEVLAARGEDWQMFPEQFRKDWREAIGKPWPLAQIDRMRFVLLEHEASDIALAMGRTHNADFPGWKYFKTVLEGGRD